MSVQPFGFELLQKITESDISKREDRYVVLAHWALVFRGFRCLGLGDSTELKGDEITSELLPEGWSKSSQYLIRYIFKNKLYILRALSVANDFIINLIRAEDKKIESLILEMTDGQNEIKSLDLGKHQEKFETELFSSFDVKEKETVNDPKVKPLVVTCQRCERNASRSLLADPDEPFGIYGYGRSDLDPLGRLGGGNLMNPMRPPRVRYDPLGPLPDQMQPPRGGLDFGFL